MIKLALTTPQHNPSLGMFSIGSGGTNNYVANLVALNTNVCGYKTPDFNHQAFVTSLSLGAVTHTLELRVLIGLNNDTANISYGDGRILIRKGETLTIPVNTFIREGEINVNVMRIFDGNMAEITPTAQAPVSVSGTMMVTGNLYPIDYDDTAPLSTLFIGDSITKAATGITTVKDSWTWITRNNLRKNAERTRIQVNGHSGTNSLYHLNLQRVGKYDFPDLSKIFVLLGTNDAAQAVTAATYLAQMTELVNYFHDTMPETEIYVLGPTPTDNNTWDGLLTQYRSGLYALWGVPSSRPRVHYIDLGDSFNRTTQSFYASTDTAGSKIHLSVSGNAAVAANLFTKYQALP